MTSFYLLQKLFSSIAYVRSHANLNIPPMNTQHYAVLIDAAGMRIQINLMLCASIPKMSLRSQI